MKLNNTYATLIFLLLSFLWYLVASILGVYFPQITFEQKVLAGIVLALLNYEVLAYYLRKDEKKVENNGREDKPIQSEKE